MYFLLISLSILLIKGLSKCNVNTRSISVDSVENVKPLSLVEPNTIPKDSHYDFLHPLKAVFMCAIVIEWKLNL